MYYSRGSVRLRSESKLSIHALSESLNFPSDSEFIPEKVLRFTLMPYNTVH